MKKIDKLLTSGKTEIALFSNLLPFLYDNIIWNTWSPLTTPSNQMWASIQHTHIKVDQTASAVTTRSHGVSNALRYVVHQMATHLSSFVLSIITSCVHECPFLSSSRSRCSPAIWTAFLSNSSIWSTTL